MFKNLEESFKEKNFYLTTHSLPLFLVGQVNLYKKLSFICQTDKSMEELKVKINSIEKFESSSHSVHIALSPLKNVSRFEWFVEKSTELGISQITPLVCEYSEKKKVNMDRLERILISSLKQSNQFFKPIINSIKTFEDFIRDNEDELLMANLKTSNKIKRELFTQNNICLMIGPEGGFSDGEIKLAKKQNIKEVSLGNSRLRSETAAIFGLSVIKSLVS